MADLPTNLQRLDNNSDEILAITSDIGDAIVAKGGTLPANAGLRSFADAIEDIPNTYTAEDEGKVVSSGALVAQTAMPAEITVNDTYDTTLYNSIVVNVPSAPTPTPPAPHADVVRFIDYDGTILHTYTPEQFLALESLPSNPTHSGLTSQGWNWSLSDAKTYVTDNRNLDIGQMYITDDGKTRLYITLTEGRTSPLFQLYLNANSELDIDWGDGSTHSTFTSTSADYKSERHEYAIDGDYVIAITVVSGGFQLASSSSNVSSILWNGNDSTSSPDRAYNNAIKKVEIGSGITNINFYAFCRCHSLTSITIPDSVTSIGSYAFQYCYSLTSVVIPDTVTSIGERVFQTCYTLSSITIPDTVTSIGQYAFQYCYALSSVTIPNKATSIGDNAFNNCYSLSSLTIPDGVTRIGNYAFAGCYALTSVTIPDKVTTIGNNAFQYCGTLSSITIPDKVTSISGYTFQNCYSLTSITIPDSVTSIVQNAFQNCSSLTSVTIGNNVTSIGTSAFNGCYSLSSITISNKVTSIGTSAFAGCSYMSFIKFTSTTPPTVSSSNTWSGVSTSTKILVPADNILTYKTATNYPNPSTYSYIGYGTYAVGEALPYQTTDPTIGLLWYASIDDWTAETNPITVGNGSEVYAKTAVVTSITRETDFVNNVTTRSTDAIEALNVYRNMKRCNVADDGTINAYDGDLTYTEDGSNGQVMVKVNKFYYKLDVSQTGDLDGVNIRKGRWSVADTKLDNSYKLHPAFLAADGVTELDYFLYGAFDGVGQDENGVYNTSYNTATYKLGSVGGNTYDPSNNFTRTTVRTMATNRGTGWYQAGVKQTMALQMLFGIEYGFNSQLGLGYGVVNASAAAKTGITTGSISSGTKENQTTPVNWRGIENLWGNIWKYIDGLNINDRIPYVCDTFAFADDTSTGYTQIGFNVPTDSGTYVSAFGYDSNNDWVLLPSEATGADQNSAIGDAIYTNTGWRVAGLGGRWINGFKAGLFCWSLNGVSSIANSNLGSRLMYIPQTT